MTLDTLSPVKRPPAPIEEEAAWAHILPGNLRDETNLTHLPGSEP